MRVVKNISTSFNYNLYKYWMFHNLWQAYFFFLNKYKIVCNVFHHLKYRKHLALTNGFDVSICTTNYVSRLKLPDKFIAPQS